MKKNLFNIETITKQKGLRLSDTGDHLIAPKNDSLSDFSAWPTLTVPELSIITTYDFGNVHASMSKKTATFRVDGYTEPKWTIATNLFSGKSKLVMKNDGDSYTLTLKNAHFPGTSIPANFTARIQEKTVQNVLTWTMRLSFSWGGFDAEFDLKDWLTGQVQARSTMLLEGEVCPLSQQGGISIAPYSEAVFFPSWLFCLHKDKGILFSGLGAGITFNTLVLAVLSKEMQGVIPNPPDCRSLFLLFRITDGPFEIPLWPDQKDVQGWSFTWNDPPFHVLSMETAETQDGVVTRAIVATGGPNSQVSFLPGADVVGDTGTPFSVELFPPVFSAIYNGSGVLQGAGLFGGIVKRPRWLHTKTASLLLTLTQRGLFAMLQIGNRFFMGHPQELITPYQGEKYRVTGLHFHLNQMAARPGEGVSTPVYCSKTTAFLTFKSRPEPLTPNQCEILITPGLPEAELTFPLNPVVSFLRPHDLLFLLFRFLNLRLKTKGDVARLVKQGTAPPRMVVVFPPQSIGEQSFLEKENTANNEKVTVPATSRLSGQSRLVFDMENGVPFNLESLLDWTDTNNALIGPHLAPTAGATVASTVSICKPDGDETAIEAPFRLVISPDENGVWNRERKEDLRPNVELWHKRLNKSGDEFPKIRAIWTHDPSFDPNAAAKEPKPIDPNAPDPYDPNDYEPFKLASLSCNDRGYIVTNSVRDEAVTARRLMLSSLGAWLDLHKIWDNPNLTLEQWDHKMTLGRDQFVKVVSRGYLGHFAHKGVVIAVTERKIEDYTFGMKIAPLRTRFYIVVKEPERFFPFPDDNIPVNDPMSEPGRSMPFTSVRILDKMTPVLDLPSNSEIYPGSGKEAFWPKVGEKDFMFHLSATDFNGNVFEFPAPLFFVRSFDENLDSQSSYEAIIADVLDKSRTCNITDLDSDLADPGLDTEIRKRHTYDFNGRDVAFAQSTSGSKADTAFEADRITFRAVQYKYPEDPDPLRPFNPMIHEARVFVPSLRQFGNVKDPLRVRYFTPYLKSGFGGSNSGEVFIRFINGVDMDFGQNNRSDKVGGLVTPSMTSTGLSRRLGVVGSKKPTSMNDNSHLDTIAGGTFNPAEYFGDAKILGGISLVSLLGSGLLDVSPAPKWTHEKTGEAYIQSLTWSTKNFVPHTIFKFDASTSLSIAVTVTQQQAQAGGGVVGNLKFFAVEFAGIFRIDFNHIRFVSEAGRKPDMDVNVKGVTFLGALGFLSRLVDALHLDQFSDPPSVDVSTDGVIVGYSLSIPSVAIGAFALQNLALSSSLSLPFTGQAMRVRFALSERHDPFLVTVSLFTGGGFFAVALGPDNVEMVEASLEFGGSFSLNLGVASGSVYVMAGIYFKIEIIDTTESVQLTGYVRAGGCVEVLGLISVSLEFYLGLTYDFSTKMARGEATLEVEVEVLFFSTSVTLTVRREYSAGSKDIPFLDMMAINDWNMYCDAFAVEE
ncbi:MAG: hypothetical protein Q7U64_08795 [Desulfocapsaceae bacterium]|nr:hypothetical protein [Desulfocapsaceae bacterium]